MGNCEFISELNRLRKSSSDSIDNVEKFDDFKKYMHVTRSAEEDLKNILRCVNSSNKKTLVLLCGSAGDGKSHLLSYLKNSDAEHLIDHYTVYNDATESRAPSKTAIETLNDLLADFKDFNIGNAGKNVILAINLVLHPVSNDTLRFWKNLLYSIKNGIGGRRYATLHCHADKR